MYQQFLARVTFFAVASAALLAGPVVGQAPRTEPSKEIQKMELGAFSVSLAVKDIQASKAFYEKLGFKEIGGQIEQNWLILQNGTTTIGLFQGMFENNILTFNPGWDADQNELKSFEDVRSLQERLKAGGLDLHTEADPEGRGPASFVLLDPDGNTILVDQHVNAPGESK